MDAKYIAAAIPVFFLLMAVEVLWSRRRGAVRYAFQDSVNNLSCGIGQQIIGVLFHAVPVALYVLLYERARIFTISPRSAWAWLALLLGVDLCYYAYHRASHRVNFLWASHIVHHQSEEYNLSVALRQAWLAQFFGWVFYLPLAVLGFPPLMYLVMHTLNTLYQFWIHTRAVGRLGALEWVMNTPSHHRVHHGVDPRYIDKNYAGIFIIWDRLFQTFREEDGEPVYGTVRPLASWNPVWANVEHWVRMARMARATARLRDKLKLWFMPPEWRPGDLGGPVVIPEVSRAAQRKYQVPVPRGIAVYVAVNFALVAVATTAFLLLQGGEVPRGAILCLAGAILVSLASWGGLFEGRWWALPLEGLRLALILATTAWWTRSPAAWALCGGLCLGLGVWAAVSSRAAGALRYDRGPA